MIVQHHNKLELTFYDVPNTNFKIINYNGLNLCGVTMIYYYDDLFIDNRPETETASNVQMPNLVDKMRTS